MQPKFSTDYKILSSMCDSTAKLGIPQCISLFMDLATIHAEQLKVDAFTLGEKNLAWVATKTKLKIFKMPYMNSQVKLSTWPEKPEKIRFNRYYTVNLENELLVAGKTEWAVIDKASGRPQKADNVYPQNLEFLAGLEEIEPFVRVNSDFADGYILDCYTVKSTDIDLYGHMNNAAYVRALFSLFSTKELEEMGITGFEIAYRIPCFEGEMLRIVTKKTDNRLLVAMIKEDGNAAATAIIETK
ncbi:MAG: hypothetical protein E7561_01180 [Ruminococcaceae bacterium]|nr:hypothetical protein [Oscillospiraceae bacterium]